MPVLVETIAEFKTGKPFQGMTVGFRLHLEPKTAVLIEALLAGGAEVIAMGNEGTTQFGTAEVLSSQGCEVLIVQGKSRRRPLSTSAELLRQDQTWCWTTEPN